MKRKIIYSIMLLCTMFSLTGCWDSEELDDRHIVLEMALDKAEDKGHLLCSPQRQSPPR